MVSVDDGACSSSNGRVLFGDGEKLIAVHKFLSFLIIPEYGNCVAVLEAIKNGQRKEFSVSAEGTVFPLFVSFTVIDIVFDFQ